MLKLKLKILKKNFSFFSIAKIVLEYQNSDKILLEEQNSKQNFDSEGELRI